MRGRTLSHERLERKVTSILLGLIMITGSVSFALPGVSPIIQEAYATDIGPSVEIHLEIADSSPAKGPDAFSSLNSKINSIIFIF